MDKFIVDGEAAVLVSRGYGAGWGSYGLNVFDPDIVEAILTECSDDQIYTIAKRNYPNEYLGGLEGLEIQWVTVGVRFRIVEYDGAESLLLEDDHDWETA